MGNRGVGVVFVLLVSSVLCRENETPILPPTTGSVYHLLGFLSKSLLPFIFKMTGMARGSGFPSTLLGP